MTLTFTDDEVEDLQTACNITLDTLDELLRNTKHWDVDAEDIRSLKDYRARLELLIKRID